MKEEFEQHISATTRTALKICGEAADSIGLSIFLIGGVVRDIIIGKMSLDTDITVQGNAIEFANCLQERYGEDFEVKEVHECFKTAKVLFRKGQELITLDIASTRKESYPYPSSLPVIEETGCALYEDVIRRDFSINSMALSLNQRTFCELIDYLGGYDDLQKGLIRVLHPLSFIDDPTRIIRALKFSVRFGYRLENETERLMRECLDSGQFDNLAGERIKLELKQAFNTNRAEGLNRFVNEGIYRLVDTGIPPLEIGAVVQDSVNKYCSFIKTPENIWLVYLGALLADLPAEKVGQVSKSLYLSGIEERILLKTVELCGKTDTLNNAQSRFEVYEFFEKADIEAVVAFAARNGGLQSKVDLYLNELKDIKTTVNGDTLIGMGLKPGPVFGEVLRNVLAARVNDEISAEDEVGFAKTILESSQH